MFRVIIISFFLSGCASTPPKKVIPKCDFSTFNNEMSEARAYIWGSPSHATFGNSWKSITSARLKNNVTPLYRVSLNEAKSKKLEYQRLESNIIKISNETEIIKRNIDNGYCKAGSNVESYRYINEINTGANFVLSNFSKYYQIIEKNIARIKVKEENLAKENKNKKALLSREAERELLYRSYKGTTVKSKSFVVQLEDFNNDNLYFSVKNISSSKIKKLFPKRCLEYDNELGGVSCIWKSNVYLKDNYGNKYDLYISRKSKSFKQLKSDNGEYVFGSIDLYPDEKLYFKLGSQKVINNTMLKMHFNSEFFGYESVNSLSFPSNI